MNSRKKTVVVLGNGFTKAFIPQMPLVRDGFDIKPLFDRYPKVIRPTAYAILRGAIKNDAGQEFCKVTDIEILMTRLDNLMPYDFRKKVTQELELLYHDLKEEFVKQIRNAISEGLKSTSEKLPNLVGKFAEYCILNQIKQLPIDEIIIVTNNKFASHFEEWAKEKKDFPITVINDNTMNNDDRLGTVGDLQFAINQANVDDDIFVIAGDNLFTCDISQYYNTCKMKNSPVLGVIDVKTKEEAKKMGVIEINEGQQIIECIEKPDEPKSTLIVTMVQFYPKEVVPLIKQYLDEGNKPDRMGDFVTWLIHKKPVFAYFLEDWIDIGTPEQLEAARANPAKFK